MFNRAQLEHTQLSHHHVVYDQGLFPFDLTIANGKAWTILRGKTGILETCTKSCLSPASERIYCVPDWNLLLLRGQAASQKQSMILLAGVYYPEGYLLYSKG